VTRPVADARPDFAARAARPEAVASGPAAQAFEALFLAQILERAQEPVFESRLLGGGSGGSLYRSMLAQEVAARMAARGGFGLADALQAAAAAKETR
jgi:Rod binding domain-containing protein